MKKCLLLAEVSAPTIAPNPNSPQPPTTVITPVVVAPPAQQ